MHLSGNINLGELIVGVGTLALAVITWRLARATGESVAAARDGVAATEKSAKAAEDGVAAARVSASAARDGVQAARKSADAARDSADAERDSVEAMAMPYVIAVPREVGAEIYFAPRPNGERGGTLKLGLWNLGSGPGLVSKVRLVCRREPLLVDLTRWITLGAGNQFLEADIDAVSWPTAPETATLQIEYLHSNGRSYRTDSDVEIKGNVLKCLTFRRSLAEEPGGG